VENILKRKISITNIVRITVVFFSAIKCIIKTIMKKGQSMSKKSIEKKIKKRLQKDTTTTI
jgi:hypothetical protein